MFDPIAASQEIRDSYIDYITTTFHMADDTYQKQLHSALREEGAVARGPFLDIGGSFETGKTLRELMEEGVISSLFDRLEPIPEAERELKLDRPLYRHQEEALRKASRGMNLVITTGTGSGKTESFLLPIIQHLLKEQEAGTLGPGVRAIIIYPMNALANDQMKRMRALFKQYPWIRYGVYNGNTEHSQAKALIEYRRTFQDQNGQSLDPAPNEVISREVMQQEPPHILITNYSMLEYMMIRPKDDAVFTNAELRFIVLDEAHIYKGATGMETSLLMRRLRARISRPDSVQYILTSATLGGPEADSEVLQFAARLSGVNFQKEGIIRSKEKHPPMDNPQDFPLNLFEELHQFPQHTGEILKKYQADFALDKGDAEKLYRLCLHSNLFSRLRQVAKGSVTVAELKRTLTEGNPLTTAQLVAFIDVCARAELDGASLIKPRYHFFVRALEGAYITLGMDKRLFLQRKEYLSPEEGNIRVFEAAVCGDCGRVAIVGKEEDGFLRQTAQRGLHDNADYFYITQDLDEELFEDEDAEEKSNAPEEFVVCAKCGAIAPYADVKLEQNSKYKHFCDHGSTYWIKVRKATKREGKGAICPACGFGSLRRFYLGSEAATSVLGTELFEQLPSEEVTEETPSVSNTRRSLFSRTPPSRLVRKKRTRQFLCFSDSRSEAAFFASYMERSYQEFLRRRGIWCVAEMFRQQGRDTVSVAEFVLALTRFFEVNRCFAEWDEDSQDTGLLAAVSKSNAWVAVLNEMFNARRSTSLVSLGVLYFEYTKNDGFASAFQDEFGIPEADARALWELLVQDGIFTGALYTSDQALTAAEREYVFFSPVEKKLHLMKTAADSKHSWISGWRGRKRSNGNYYVNSKLLRLSRGLGISFEDADELLADYWDNVLVPDKEDFQFDAKDFRVRIGGTPGVQFYRCKKCGRVTPFFVRGRCASVKCSGTLEPFDPQPEWDDNHYAKLYRSNQVEPLYIKEHTAQLAKDQQTRYQEAFVHKKLNALSCSTTFEMGVDVGSLETVYMRDVPPSPANYVQRAGRAGRSKGSAAFVLTYAKLSSHDFTYYQDPAAMISGNIKAPVFEIENEKILSRHIYAVAIGTFLKENPWVYDGDGQATFLLEGGYEKLKEFLARKPKSLQDILLRSIPLQMHQRMGLLDFSWVERLCGEDGVLEIAIQDFRGTVAEMEKQVTTCRRRNDMEGAGNWSRNLRFFRCGKQDNAGKKSFISFLVRNNVLPKYGFPVDTVELIPDKNAMGKDRSLQLARDLQMAIAEYAPGAQVVADGKMYTSRYIRKMPNKTGESSWERGYYCPQCPSCGQPNFTREPITSAGRECVSCHRIIGYRYWRKTLEPRMGFVAEPEVRPVPMHQPERDFKTDDYYIGDPHRNLIQKRVFQVNDQILSIESTSNDSLVVVGQSAYTVCPVCGYATEGPLPLKHKNSNGFPCRNQDGKGTEYRLSHDFKTDVVRLSFFTEKAADMTVMLSVLYTLLEGLSRELEIERTDIKGCLFWEDLGEKMGYAIVLYDSVAGGAGHVRRMVTDHGEIFQRVLRRGLAVADDCSCGSSCYQCLRNYYNQKIHDLLDRKAAVEFLRPWVGAMKLVAEKESH